jgi:hypothetical protein
MKAGNFKSLSGSYYAVTHQEQLRDRPCEAVATVEIERFQVKVLNPAEGIRKDSIRKDEPK